MKKTLFTFAALAAAFLAAISCSNLDLSSPAETSEEGNFTVTFDCSMAETKTAFHGKTIWWSKGDEVLFAQNATVNGEENTYKTVSFSLLDDIETFSATIPSFNTPDEGTDAVYYSVYPYSTHKARLYSNGIPYPRLTLPCDQNPTSDCFDPNADILISNYAHNLEKNSDGKYSVMLSYTRPSAIAKMKIKNLPSSNPIASIKFSAKSGSSNVVLAGSHIYDLVNGEMSTLKSSSCKDETEITLNYSTPTSVDTAYFCCYPFELGAGDSFKVVVTTSAGESFMKNVKIPEGKTLSMKSGRGSKFTVDMSGSEDWLIVDTERFMSDITITSVKYGISINTSYVDDIESIKFTCVEKSVFDGISDISAYVDEKGTPFSDSNISNINGGKIIPATKSSLNIDSEYVVIVKATSETLGSTIVTKSIRTDWFKLAAVTRSAGGIQVQMTSNSLKESQQNYRVIATSSDPDFDYEAYYLNTLAPGKVSTLGKSVNDASSSYNLGVTKYYASKTVQADMVSGESYTVMIMAEKIDGTKKFYMASATAK